jgi:hypothetical protein
MEGPVGFEPTTPGLKVRSSTAELRAPLSRNRIWRDPQLAIEMSVSDSIADKLPTKNSAARTGSCCAHSVVTTASCENLSS